jgi:hypothetical protein
VRVVLDECLPRRLKRQLTGHDVSTVPEAGWAGLVNGELLRRMSGACDAFITIDKNLPAQQEISSLPFGVIVLRALSNRIEDLQPLAPKILEALAALQPGQIVRVEAT